jgi:hypothetical protein
MLMQLGAQRLITNSRALPSSNMPTHVESQPGKILPVHI